MRMLLVEDDEVLGDGLKSVLIQNYHTVDWVRDAESALPVLATARFDLIILDLNLPGRTGLEMLESLREEGHSIPVLVVTARTQVSDRILALDGGAGDGSGWLRGGGALSGSGGHRARYPGTGYESRIRSFLPPPRHPRSGCGDRSLHRLVDSGFTQCLPGTGKPSRSLRPERHGDLSQQDRYEMKCRGRGWD